MFRNGTIDASTSSSATTASFSASAELRNCSTSDTFSRGRTNSRGSDPRQLLQLLWLVPVLTFPNVFALSLSPHLHLLKTSHRCPSRSSLLHLFVCRCSQISRQWLCRCNVGELLTLTSPRSLSRCNCLTFLGKACVPPQEVSHALSHLDFESWRLAPRDLFEPSLHHDEFSLSPPLSTGWSTSCHGCLRDHEFDWADRRR